MWCGWSARASRESRPATPSCSAGRRLAVNACRADRVIRSCATASTRRRTVIGCRRERHDCTTANERVAAFLGTACFADYAVVAEAGAIPVPRDVPFDVLATLGCAVVTGVGAVMNAAQVPSRSSVVVIGAGGVGLNVVQGAALAGSERIIAVDRQPAPLALSRVFGATDVALAPASVADAVRDLTGGLGADYVFDTVGSPSTVADAVAATRKGGTIVVTGLARIDGVASLPMFPFQEKRHQIDQRRSRGSRGSQVARRVLVVPMAHRPNRVRSFRRRGKTFRCIRWRWREAIARASGIARAQARLQENKIDVPITDRVEHPSED